MISAYELWEQSGHDGEKYRALMREHGLIRDLAPGEKAVPLPCGWPGPRGQSLTERVVAKVLRLMLAHPDWREGQAVFNAVHEVAPYIAEKIRGTEADPFYDDSKTEACFVAIAEMGTP